MALVSSRVAAGVNALAAAFNNLRDDLLSNHDHTSGQGGVIDHADLADSAISGQYHTHTNVETHMSGTVGSFGDTPGEEFGIHGLSSGMAIAGCAGKVTQTEGGAATDPDGNQYVEVAGKYTPTSRDMDIDFGSTFVFDDPVEAVWVTPIHSDEDSRASMAYQVYGMSTTGFSVRFGRTPVTVCWRAMGTKT